MSRCRSAILGLLILLLAVANTTHAADPSIPPRQWLEDVALFEAEVIKPLTEQFAAEECVPKLGHYLERYFDRLKPLRGQLHLKSYLLFREIALITAQDIGIYVDGSSAAQTGVCKRWRVWRDGMLVHLQNKIEFIGNVFSLTVWE